jgi:hypothetical protein
MSQPPDEHTVLGHKIADRVDAPTRIAQRPAALRPPAQTPAPLDADSSGSVARTPAQARERYGIRRFVSGGQSIAEIRAIFASQPWADGAGLATRMARSRRTTAIVVIVLAISVSVLAIAALVWLLGS